eukprot:6987237-Prorocentrum_lima.AAC.1
MAQEEEQRELVAQLHAEFLDQAKESAAAAAAAPPSPATPPLLREEWMDEDVKQLVQSAAFS